MEHVQGVCVSLRLRLLDRNLESLLDFLPVDTIPSQIEESRVATDSEVLELGNLVGKQWLEQLFIWLLVDRLGGEDELATRLVKKKPGYLVVFLVSVVHGILDKISELTVSSLDHLPNELIFLGLLEVLRLLILDQTLL